MSDYTDPRERDPRFPDRPTHPDFDTLSEAVQDMDFRAEKVGEPIPEIVGVDWDSLFYVIRNRLGITGQRMHRDLDEPRWHALYLDAFTLGKVYAETKARGGTDAPRITPLDLRVLDVVREWDDEEFQLAFGFNRTDTEES